ncbi:MAG: hypothetical protein ACLTXH_05390 [Enterobacter hormaechei]
MSFTEQEVADLTKRIQNAGTEVVKRRRVAVLQPCLWARRRHVSACWFAVAGEKGFECAYPKATVNTLLSTAATG